MIYSNRPVAAVITYLSTVVPIYIYIIVWVLPKPHIKDTSVCISSKSRHLAVYSWGRDVRETPVARRDLTLTSCSGGPL